MTRTPNPDDLNRIARACICQQTRMTAHAVTRAYNRVLGSYGLEVTQFSILALLATGGAASVTALSDALALDRTTMTRNLKRMVTAGLVEATSGNGRAIRHALTEKGIERLTATMPVWEAEHARLEGAVGVDVWARTRDGLRAIRRTLKAREA